MYDITKTSMLARLFQSDGPRISSRFRKSRSSWYQVRKTRYKNSQSSVLFENDGKNILSNNFLKDINDDIIRPRWIDFTKLII